MAGGGIPARSSAQRRGGSSSKSSGSDNGALSSWTRNTEPSWSGAPGKSDYAPLDDFFLDDAVLPEQILPPPRSPISEGVRQFMLAMLEDVRRIMAREYVAVGWRRQYVRDCAWLNGADAPISFETVCAALGLSPAATRRFLLDAAARCRAAALPPDTRPSDVHVNRGIWLRDYHMSRRQLRLRDRSRSSRPI